MFLDTRQYSIHFTSSTCVHFTSSSHPHTTACCSPVSRRSPVRQLAEGVAGKQTRCSRGGARCMCPGRPYRDFSVMSVQHQTL
ncbi:hypothetical protein E2C01_101444 [Portunus trituberculatus]|uniref:Uncharacterized protein n=1 Tax=Portunus trituberculatus TaxID=210409 RepID=A0A5B7KFQ7_PORTR|nr:hypothetical protein [Portunus trituberculatus]